MQNSPFAEIESDRLGLLFLHLVQQTHVLSLVNWG